jgi:LemA protein
MKTVSKKWIILGVVVILAIILYSSIKGTYNNMVSKEEAVTAQWAQVENVYQRRADLIPNLMATVKGYADFEQETLTRVIEARSKATSVTIDPTNLNEASLQQFQAAQDGLGSALSRLLVTIERYPDLKANQNFLDLQTQLERTENRITVERMNFNEQARNFFTRQQKEDILLAIKNAELDTSGEIRVHIEEKCPGDVMDRAAQIFDKLHMQNTELRNGVLFYLALKNRKFAVLGDSGINRVVPENFWDEVRDIMLNHFRENHFTEGLLEGITLAGRQLKDHFPFHKDDVNELPDEISFGD